MRAKNELCKWVSPEAVLPRGRVIKREQAICTPEVLHRCYRFNQHGFTKRSILEIKEDYAIAKKYYLSNRSPWFYVLVSPLQGSQGFLKKSCQSNVYAWEKKLKANKTKPHTFKHPCPGNRSKNSVLNHHWLAIYIPYFKSVGQTDRISQDRGGSILSQLSACRPSSQSPEST